MSDDPTPDLGYPAEAVYLEAEPAGPGPRKRAARTVVQAVLAFLGAIPGAHLALTAAGVDLSARTTALLLGIPSALVIVISAVWNAVDQRKGNG